MDAVIELVARLLQLVLLARVLVSWIPVDPYHPIIQTLYQITEPVLEPIRQLLPPGGGIDFSPLIAMLLVQVLAIVLTSIV